MLEIGTVFLSVSSHRAKSSRHGIGTTGRAYMYVYDGATTWYNTYLRAEPKTVNYNVTRNGGTS